MKENQNLSEKAIELFKGIANGEAVDTNYIIGHLPAPRPLQDVYYIERDSKGMPFAKRLDPKKLFNALKDVRYAQDIQDKLIQGTSAYNNLTTVAGYLNKYGDKFIYENKYAVDLDAWNNRNPNRFVNAEALSALLTETLHTAVMPKDSNKYRYNSNIINPNNGPEISTAEMFHSDY